MLHPGSAGVRRQPEWGIGAPKLLRSQLRAAHPGLWHCIPSLDSKVFIFSCGMIRGDSLDGCAATISTAPMNSSACRQFRRLGFALAALYILLVMASNAFAWGQEGHRVVATIAQAYLTAQASAKVQEILGSDGSMAAVATWADEVRPSRPLTAPWHYIDIPLNTSDIDMARDCRNGDCVTAAITRFLAVLSDDSSTSAARNEALKFIIHFVGDLHQPLHSGDNNDRGGNGLQVTFFGRNTNLHSVWDTLLIEHIDANTDNYATMLGAKIEDSDISAWQQGTVEVWALESHEVATKVAYGALPPGQKADLGMDYLKAVAPAIDLQLARAGIRLAYILNRVFQ